MFNYFIANIFNIFYSYSSRIKTYDMHVHPVVKQYMVSLLSVVDCVMGGGGDVLEARGGRREDLKGGGVLGTLFDPCRLAYLAYTSND
jgi:hypothetical protein